MSDVFPYHQSCQWPVEQCPDRWTHPYYIPDDTPGKMWRVGMLADVIRYIDEKRARQKKHGTPN